MGISRRAAALVVALGIFASGTTQASAQSSQVPQDAAKNFYRTLPKEVKSNPVVKRVAKDLGLVDKPKTRAGRTATAADCTNCVALTFDDGPAGHTTRLLDLLYAKNAEASFFVVGPNARSNAGMLKRMADSGMTVGNHSMTHRQLNQLSYQQVAQEIQQGNDIIQRNTGSAPRWMRPPYGATNPTVARAAGDKGMALAMWQIDTLDWKYRDPARTCRVAVNESQAGDIVLMHDIHATTVDAVSCIIDGLRAKGLEPVSLDRLIPKPVPGKTYSRK